MKKTNLDDMLITLGISALIKQEIIKIVDRRKELGNDWFDVLESNINMRMAEVSRSESKKLFDEVLKSMKEAK